MNPGSDNIPPRLARRFLRWFLRDDLAEEVEGDLEEKFSATVEEHSHRRAKLNYWYQVFHYLRPFAIKNLTTFYQPTHYAMYRNYFKIGWRNLFKHKGYSFINIGGLAVGMAVAILIGLWVYDELSFNKYHDNYKRIAWVMQNQTFENEIKTWGSQAMQLAPVLRQEYGSHFEHVIMSSFTEGRILSYDEKVLTKTGNFMEPAAPDMLSLSMLKGTRAGLKGSNSILLAESTAQALFGEAGPLGKTIQIDNRLNVTVTGVYEDLPNTSSFSELMFVAPWDLKVKSEDLEERVGWGNSWFQTLVQVAENVPMDQASIAIKDAKLDHVDQDDARFNPELFLHSMPRWNLYSRFENGVNTGGRIEFVWLFGIIGGFVLLLACINFMNLSTARSEKRAKEVGVRKVVGSVRGQLISQFFSESLLTAALAFVLSILLVQITLPWFNQVADKEVAILWTSPLFWLVGIGFTVFTGLLAGSYPAFYLSSFRPTKVLKGTFRAGRLASVPRQVLVVVQFSVSVTLIIGTIIVYQQIQFAKDRPIGYEREGLITIPMKTEEVYTHYETFRNDLLATGAVDELTISEGTVANTYTTNGGFEWSGKDPNMQDEIFTLAVNQEFGKTINWEIKEGRDFSRDFATDTAAFVLNEAAVEYMGLDNPVGETVRAFGREYTIIGVVKNMVTQSLYQPTQQMIFYVDSFDRANVITAKINASQSVGEALATVEATFKKHYPATPFEYGFIDEEYAAKFATEARVGKLSGFFAVLAILISCLGLFGLASFVAEQRTKEIGIRKVLGASVAQLWQLLSRDFVVLVAISCGVAIPVAYYFLHGWLQDYEYRTALHWWVFAAAGSGALVITLLTVSYQTIRAALANPVKSLRSE